jgi:hypothetical protein
MMMERERMEMLVKSHFFRWMPGMLVQLGLGNSPSTCLVSGSGSGQEPELHAFGEPVSELPDYAFPDLTHPPTLGCLTHLARRALVDIEGDEMTFDAPTLQWSLEDERKSKLVWQAGLREFEDGVIPYIAYEGATEGECLAQAIIEMSF